MKPTSYALSDVGKVRDNNEDRYYCDDTHRVYAVADGIGGKPGGETASQAIVDAIAERADSFARLIRLTETRSDCDDPLLSDAQRDSIFCELSQALQQINEEVYHSGNTSAFQEGIGSTVDLVVMGRRSAFILHVGDSRVYLVRSGEIFRVTSDHTYSEHLREHPELLGKQQQPERFSHILTRSMGGRPHVDVDRLFVDLMPGDRLILCTDGITDYLAGAEILEFATKHGDDSLPRQLVACANERGGKDNATSVVVGLNDDANEFSRAATRPDTFRSVRFLQSVELFSELEFQEMLKLLRYLRAHRYDSSQRIISHNDPVDGMYFVMSGSLQVERAQEYVDQIYSGGHFGEFGLFGKSRRLADVRCLEKCEILFLSQDNLQQLRRDDPALCNKLLWKLLANTTEFIQKMMDTDDTIEE